jgi:hypothetical protein
VVLRADNADVSVTQLPSNGPIQFNASGAGGGIADTINVNVGSMNGVVFDDLRTHYTHIATDAVLLDIKKANVVNRGEFFNRYNGVLLDNDNNNKQMVDIFDLQLYDPLTFSLIFAQMNVINSSATPLYKKPYITYNGDPRPIGTPEFDDPLNKNETAFNLRDLDYTNRDFVPPIVIEGYSVEPVEYDDQSLKEDEDAIENAEELELSPTL